MEKAIIGRKNEITRLKKYIASDRSEFIAIYGRRRVGKTFLVKELLEGQFTFRMTGKENCRMADQLLNFSYAMADYFGEERVPKDWTEAFRMLSKAIERLKDGTKIIFIDELPWLDTQKSKFINALEYFWNNWAYYRSDIKLIICGSATSWMLNKIINARGGLHNRVTHKILVSPFTLHETELYFNAGGFDYERTEIIDCYMAVGGVAYYLSLFENDKSVAENINALCFTKGGELCDEFDKLFKSLFKKADNYITVINALSTVGKGMTRNEIIEKTKLTNNGNLTTLLNELEQCEFIRSFVPFRKEKKDTLYQLVDQFSLFHFHFIKGQGIFTKDYWMKKIGTASYNAWSGYAFETVCLHHIDQIVEGLGISGTINRPCSWAYRPSKAVKENDDIDDNLKVGGQIDLLIDRSDKTITVCEMKYSDGEYEIDKAYDKHVQDRLRLFRDVEKTTKTLQVAYVTPHGLYNNQYARKVKKQITAEHLFRQI
ncbi:MAG: ATP-binding protein [Prevotella sp.]|nr:ATP-binding protein [Prevotella sp.]